MNHRQDEQPQARINEIDQPQFSNVEREGHNSSTPTTAIPRETPQSKNEEIAITDNSCCNSKNAPTLKQQPITSINFPPRLVDDDQLTCVSSITSAFQDAELHGPSLYPSTQEISNAWDYEAAPSSRGRSSGMIPLPTTTNSVIVPKPKVTETLPAMEERILRKTQVPKPWVKETLPALEERISRKTRVGEARVTESLPAMEERMLRKTVVPNPRVTQTLPAMEERILRKTPVPKPRVTETLPAMEQNILRKTPVPKPRVTETLPAMEQNILRKMRVGEAIFTGKEEDSTNQQHQQRNSESTTVLASDNDEWRRRHTTSTTASTVVAESTADALHGERDPEGLIELSMLLAEATTNKDSSLGNPWEDVLLGIMPLPSSGGTATGEEARGPGAHASATFLGTTAVNGLETEESKEEGAEFDNNNMDLVEAQLVDDLPEGRVEGELVEEESRTGRASVLGFLKGHARRHWLYPLMILSAAIMALWFILIMRKIAGARDPAKPRIRQSIEDAFGKDYFDSELKEKALHWIVREDRLQDLEVKQDMQEAETTRLIQRFSLVAFYFQTSARQPWSYCNPPQRKQSDVCFYRVPIGKTENRAARWLSAAHECQWMGVYCEGGSKTVSTLALPNQNMTGRIPSELAKLDKITKLDLSLNNLSGTLPMWINQLSSIETLQLGSNHFTGVIPPEYFSIGSLSKLHLHSNLLTGRIPSQIGLFRGHFLHVIENSLSGPIPDETYQLPNIQYLYFNGNSLTGTISTRIGQLSKLIQLMLNDCDLSGTIPSHVGLLERLTVLTMNRANIEGTIPEELYNLQSFQYLYLSDTKIGGTINSRIGKLTE